MGWGETISEDVKGSAKIAARPGKGIAIGGSVSREKRDYASELLKKPEVVLDMGEASREQGFRMNGCR